MYATDVMDTSGVQQNCPSMILGMSALARCAVTTCKRSTMSKLTTLGCIWHRDTTPRTTQHSRPNAACTCHQVHHHAGHPQPIRKIPVLQLPDKNRPHQAALALSRNPARHANNNQCLQCPARIHVLHCMWYAALHWYGTPGPHFSHMSMPTARHRQLD